MVRFFFTGNKIHKYIYLSNMVYVIYQMLRQRFDNEWIFKDISPPQYEGGIKQEFTFINSQGATAEVCVIYLSMEAPERHWQVVNEIDMVKDLRIKDFFEDIRLDSLPESEPVYLNWDASVYHTNMDCAIEITKKRCII